MVKLAGNRVRGLVAAAAGVAALTLLAAPAIAAPPANDGFASAQALGSAPVNTTGTNVESTLETGEPNHAGYSADLRTGSVWYTWTAEADGTATIALCGSSFDTLLGVYTGSAVNSLTEVASNDDDELGICSSANSSVEFDAEQGTTYRIAVDGFDDAAGSISLTLSFTDNAANDDFDEAGVLTGVPISLVATNVNATVESGEPSHGPLVPGGSTVWYSWTAPIAGTVLLDLCNSNFDTNVGVYTGSAVNSLTEIAFNDDGTNCGSAQSQLSFAATAATVYNIAVDGLGGDTGDFTLKLDYVRQTTITTKPPKRTTKRTATFGFKAVPALGATFKCKLDKQAYKNCKSPYKLRNLKVGKHTLKVQASGDPTPASYSWTVKRKR